MAFWIDKNGNAYNKDDINDRYLNNIVKYLEKGGLGYPNFINNEVIKNILDEAINRKLLSEENYQDIFNNITKAREEKLNMLKEVQDYQDKRIHDFFKDHFANIIFNR